MKMRRFLAAALPLLCAATLSSGCTLFDDYLPGSPFTPDQPEPEVSLTDGIHSGRIAGASEGCTPGGTVFWGLVTNTGDVDLADVAITIEAFDGAGGFIGSGTENVFNGEIDDSDPDNPIAGTSLDVDQSGSFTVCTTVPFGAAARTEYRTSFIVVDEAE